jgi:hypothetical protein
MPLRVNGDGVRETRSHPFRLVNCGETSLQQLLTFDNPFVVLRNKHFRSTQGNRILPHLQAYTSYTRQTLCECGRDQSIVTPRQLQALPQSIGSGDPSNV